MEKQVIRDFYGRILGSLEPQPNGDIIVRDFYGRILGKYEKYTDCTKDFYGRILFKGNMAASLIGMNGNK
ncbi:MAG: hypothetical protein SPL00_04355 [Bacilli bacterium]|nr:hypothetical protein [Bacilli bacterium]